MKDSLIEEPKPEINKKNKEISIVMIVLFGYIPPACLFAYSIIMVNYMSAVYLVTSLILFNFEIERFFTIQKINDHNNKFRKQIK